jgi:hypothetical protein
MQDRACSTLV